ncbi:hypothetical protein [Veillonella criceti]|uniref:Uncharacterized protein n=1 Tax=Veillonella criceti TaxID=103891 RepID=A0A380NLD3_9FIRM|nr:hypothetical protein [Veillonella criceti]SUP42228.1 Uncharacterised protein [Veillonella criceti]
MVITISLIVAIIIAVIYFIKQRKRGRDMPQGLQVFDEQGVLQSEVEENKVFFFETLSCYGSGQKDYSYSKYKINRLTYLVMSSGQWKNSSFAGRSINCRVDGLVFKWWNAPSNNDEGAPLNVLIGGYYE